MSILITEEEFERALEDGLKHFPGISLKPEQTNCLKSLVVDRQDVLGVLPTGYGKSLIYQLLPKVFSSFWKEKFLEDKTFQIIVVSPLELIRKQQVAKLNNQGFKSVTLESCDNTSDVEEAEIVFGSAEHWLSDKWKTELKSGSLRNALVLVVDEAHTVETW